MRGVFKSLFLLLLIVGIFFALSFVVNVSAKVTHTSVVKNVVPNVNVWNPWPPPIKKEKGGDGIAGNVWNPWPPPIKDDSLAVASVVGGSVWNPWPPPIKKEKGGDGIAGNVWNPWPPPIKKEKGGGGVAMLNSVGGSVWNPWPPPIKKEKGGDGLN